jgi:hypothetical protein
LLCLTENNAQDIVIVFLIVYNKIN